MTNLSLRWKVLVVLALVALVPVLLLGGLGLVSVRNLSQEARMQARIAVEQELRERLVSRVREKARADDALFAGVRAQAVALSHYIQWFYDNPEHLPEPGYLKGGSSLDETEYGHRVNRGATPVGVFVSRQAEMTEEVWREVGLLSFADPLLISIRASTPGAERVWVTSANRVVRIHPNVGLGQAGSPVGPGYDLTEDEPFQAAAPARNPDQVPLWTAPHADPVTGGLVISAVAPIVDKGGTFRAVVGVDMTLDRVIDSILQEQTWPVRYAILLDRHGRIISATADAWEDIGMRMDGALSPGRPLTTSLAASPRDWVRQMASGAHGVTAPGLSLLETDDGGRVAAFAPLPSTGWTMLLVAPLDALANLGGQVEASIASTERLYMMGTAAGVIILVLLVGALAAWGASGLTRPLARLVEGTRRLAGNLSFRLGALGGDELGQLATSFNSMADALERSQHEVVHHAQMVVEERSRLAREIHDTIAQGLAGVVIQLETAENAIHEPDEALARLRRARELARESLNEARRSVWNMRPLAVAEAGIISAIQGLVEALASQGFQIACQIDPDLVLAPDAEDVLFRVCQEALFNIRKHSGASAVSVSLTADGAGAVLRVTDDGQGFDPSRQTGPGPSGGFGIWSMQGRLERLGGRLSIESQPGAGTTLTARVPYEGGERRGAGDQTPGG